MIELLIFAVVVWIGWQDYKKADALDDSVFKFKSRLKMSYEKLPEDPVFYEIPRV